MMMGGGGWLMMLFIVLFWVVIVGLALWFSSTLFPHAARRNNDRQVSADDGALEILRQRYARGELTRSEYEQMRRDLEA
jgi:putative membrane protein